MAISIVIKANQLLLSKNKQKTFDGKFHCMKSANSGFFVGGEVKSFINCSTSTAKKRIVWDPSKWEAQAQFASTTSSSSSNSKSNISKEK